MNVSRSIIAAAVVCLVLAAGACGGQGEGQASPSSTSPSSAASAVAKGALPTYMDVSEDIAYVGADGTVPATGQLLSLLVNDPTFAAPGIDLAARNVEIQVEHGSEADLSGAALSQARIYNTFINGNLDLHGADLSRLLIPDAEFPWQVGGTMDLRGADLSNADLTNLVGQQWSSSKKWWGNITIDDTTVFTNTRMPKTGELYTQP